MMHIPISAPNFAALRVLAALFTLLASFGAMSAAPPPSAQVALVAKLYRDFAYEAVVEEPSPAPVFIDSSRRVLLSYLTPNLTDLLLSDRKCAETTRGICQLDFMPLWASQDAAGVVVRILPTNADDKVRVELQYHSEKRTLTYLLTRTSIGWRVRDIAYDHGIPSLAEMLKRPK